MIREFEGKKIGLWTVLKRSETKPRGHQKPVYWTCQCECGTIKDVQANNLARGVSKSCGCRKSEISRKNATKHGMRFTKEYHSWYSMIKRCHNKNNKDYYLYGQRGISVCKEWRKSFKAFFDHIGYAPSKDHSLDRINNNGNYEPGNVRWATPSQQANNKRKWGTAKSMAVA